ncbi:beta-amylase 8 [Carica papaya]|uniref:beta-amylase 8 n=1 Tax=Carica papaya TaxID=3649 RepID=UPI000B8CEEB9|nr:beta-amylase 8 [Carica papaya]
MNQLNPHSTPTSNADPIEPRPNSIDNFPQAHPVQPQPQTRRPRGFAATAAAAASMAPTTSTTPTITTTSNNNSSGNSSTSSKGKREREKEKERTKLRERHRRAITSRMLAGLRQYGNFPLPARADMNDVLAALAREAGWTVEPDGTTYRQSPPPHQMASFPVRSVESPLPSASFKNSSVKPALDGQQSILRINESLSPASLDSVVITERDTRSERYTSASPINSVECLQADQLITDVRSGEHGTNFTGTPYVPVYVMLPAGVINNFCQLVDPEGVRQELSYLKSLNVDGVSVACWWGIVERWNPQKFVWYGYRELFNIIQEFKLKLQVGLGASGELKYPSFPERMGWRYPGIGEFQCYDKYLQQNLQKAAKLRGHSFWARGPDNSGQYNSLPHETGFFCERGDYDSYYGRFFLHWYSQSLIEHADNVLSLASLAFEETRIIVKVPAVYWWYKTTSHAAELTAGYYNPTNQEGYAPVFEVLKKYSVIMKFVCPGLQMSTENYEQLADPEGLSWQVLNSAWDRGLTVAGENALSCYDREGCMRIVEMAKPRNDPDRRHFSFFTYQQPTPLVQGTICFSDLDHFTKCMHGDIVSDLVS